jgi:penicillin-insensitive murein endopeptidase
MTKTEWPVEDDTTCPDPLRPRPTQDTRGYFMLPQAPMDSGYYVYGDLHHKPAKGAYQYAHPLMMTVILRVALEWQAIDRRRIGIGDISLPNGVITPDHRSHIDGLQVDVRPLRKDGQEKRVCWWDAEYDLAGTLKMVELFRTFAPVKKVLFNDGRVPFTRPWPDHDHHMHIELRG